MKNEEGEGETDGSGRRVRWEPQVRRTPPIFFFFPPPAAGSPLSSWPSAEEGRHYSGAALTIRAGSTASRATAQALRRAADGDDRGDRGRRLRHVGHLRVQSRRAVRRAGDRGHGNWRKVVGRDGRGADRLSNEGESGRLVASWLSETDLQRRGAWSCARGHLLKGLRRRRAADSPQRARVFGRRDIPPGFRRRSSSGDRKSGDRQFSERSRGGLVVHLSRGSARYRGSSCLTRGEQQEEHMILEISAMRSRLVPVSMIHLVQKTSGVRSRLSSDAVEDR